jgi:hypothetical protein
VVKALPPDGSHPALRERVRAWRPVGQPDHPHTLAAEDLVEGSGELGVAITEEVPCSELSVLELPGQVASLLDHPGTGRMVGAAGQVHATAADLDEEQDVQPGQPDGVDDEEVGSEQMVGVLADELAPGPLAASGCRRQAMAAEYLADGQVGPPVAELEQLTLDASIAPAGVLPPGARSAGGVHWPVGDLDVGGDERRPPTSDGGVRDASGEGSRGSRAWWTRLAVEGHGSKR